MSHQLRSPEADKALEKFLDTIDAPLAARLKAFLKKAEAQGLALVPPNRLETCSLMLKSGPEEDAFNFGWFGFRKGKPAFRNYGIALRREDRTPHSVGVDYLGALADLLPDTAVYQSSDPFEWTVKKMDGSYVSIDEVLTVQDAWLALIHATVARFALFHDATG